MGARESCLIQNEPVADSSHEHITLPTNTQHLMVTLQHEVTFINSNVDVPETTNKQISKTNLVTGNNNKIINHFGVRGVEVNR